MLRVIQIAQPRWIIAENVPGLFTWNEGMVFEQVCTDLETARYEVQPVVIPACALNAPHRRDRIWFVAHSLDYKCGRGRREAGEANGIQGIDRAAGCVWGVGRTDSLYAADSGIEGLEGWGNERMGLSGQRDRNGCEERRDWSQDWPEIASDLCRVDDGLSRRVDRAKRLKALGNAIVPAVAVEIMKAIHEASQQSPGTC